MLLLAADTDYRAHATPLATLSYQFGSLPPGAFLGGMVDGFVHPFSFATDFETLCRIAIRNSRLPKAIERRLEAVASRASLKTCLK